MSHFKEGNQLLHDFSLSWLRMRRMSL